MFVALLDRKTAWEKTMEPCRAHIQTRTERLALRRAAPRLSQALSTFRELNLLEGAWETQVRSRPGGDGVRLKTGTRRGQAIHLEDNLGETQ